jgi:hypothetical protein
MTPILEYHRHGGTSCIDGHIQEALTFKAPYVVDRLIKDRVADTIIAAEELFTELKKYLVLDEVTHDMTFGMYSVMVDAAWHTFILFTTEYTNYCHRYFGRYVNHAPTVDHAGPERNSGPEPHQSDGHEQNDRPHERHHPRKPATFDDFRDRYKALFDQPLPDLWYDSNSVVPSRRVINDKAGLLTLAYRGNAVELIDDTGTAIVSVNDLAHPALAFVARTSDFYVRELPGDLTDDERVGLTQALTASRVLRVAP